ncbi:MAG: UDP-N-acetylmuramate dehydrogenase [Castellaniella sp.]
MSASPAHDLTAKNSLRLTATARDMVCFHALAELPQITARVRSAEQAFVLGGGSNVVLAPYLDSLVIQVASRGMRVVEETADSRILEVQAGVCWHDLVSQCIANEWGGLENLALIPGTVGAAPVQNIGAYGLELAQRLAGVQAWHFGRERLFDLAPDDCGLAYRDSIFRQAPPGAWLITSVRLRLPLHWEPVLSYPVLRDHASLQMPASSLTPRHIFEAVCEIRRSKLPDPAVLPNAGSFFKNPVVDAAHHARLRERWTDLAAYPQPDGRWKLAAGWLIERAGWKGRRLGAVGMHSDQALVLVNHGQADAHQVRALANRVRADVTRLFQVDLEQEPVNIF